MEKVAADTNATIAGLLRDLASIQGSKQSEWGYRRAAATVFALDEPITSFLTADGSLGKIPSIGPKSARVIREVIDTGTSATVEAAVHDSGKADEVARSRGLRNHFLSRAQVLAVMRDSSTGGPEPADYAGDLQMHSVWSDGSQTLESISAAAMERGYRYSAVTDHSQGLRIARGATMAEFLEQHQAIDRVNRGHGGRFRLIKGVEANIRADGSVDLTPNELAQFELVLAAPHLALRSSDDQTPRMLAAVQTPGVHVLAHPRGRMYGSRPGVSADWDAIFSAAAAADVAVEIDGDPARQDMDYELARRALQAGCLFALDSDAHATAELLYAETAIAHARLAGIPKERVINCWPLEQLLAWLRDRR